MANVMQRANAWIAAQLQQHASEPVSYVRDGAAPILLQAVVGNESANVDAGEVAMLRTDVKDFIVAAADLVVAGERITPRRGDQIHDAAGRVYEVAAPSGMPPWRDSDHQGLRIRIHTQLLERGEL